MENYNLNYIGKKVFEFFDGSSTKFINDKYYIIYNTCQCLEFSIGPNSDIEKDIISLVVYSLDKCSLSGTTLLLNLENFIGSLNRDGFEIEYVILTDESHITWKSEHYSLKVNLSKLKIITNGQSWYNSMGYYQDNHEEEKRQNDITRNKTFQQILYLFFDSNNKSNNLPLFYKFGGYIQVDNTDKNFETIIGEAMLLIKKTYSNYINKMSIKDLINFINIKHLTSKITNDDLFADCFIMYFCSLSITYSTKLKKSF